MIEFSLSEMSLCLQLLVDIQRYYNLAIIVILSIRQKISTALKDPQQPGNHIGCFQEIEERVSKMTSISSQIFINTLYLQSSILYDYYTLQTYGPREYNNQLVDYQNISYHIPVGFLNVKSESVQPYFFIWMQCLTTANPISHAKYISRKGQQTGIRKISNHVHSQAPKPTTHRLFQRLNSFNARRTGRSPVLVNIAALYYKNKLLSISQSGSGKPDGVKYCTIRQITQSPMMNMRPRYSQQQNLCTTQRQKAERQLHLSLLQLTVLSIIVLILRAELLCLRVCSQELQS